MESRLYGKPKESVETTVKEPESIAAIKAMTSAERRALLAQLEAQGRLRVIRDDEVGHDGSASPVLPSV